MRGGRESDFYCKSGKSAFIYRAVFSAAAVRREFYLPSCGGKFGGAAFDLGAGGGQCRRHAYGSCGDADFYSGGVSNVCAVSGDYLSSAEKAGDEAGGYCVKAGASGWKSAAWF